VKHPEVSGFELVGVFAMIVGALMCLYALFFDPSVSSYRDGYSERVVNLGLSNDRLVFAVIGSSLLIFGAVMNGLNKIHSELRFSRTTTGEVSVHASASTDIEIY
jgi:hypothetical protein